MSLISKNLLQIESIGGVIGVIKDKKATVSGGLSLKMENGKAHLP